MANYISVAMQQYTNQDLMDHLSRVDETTEGDLNASDIVRDDDGPALTTYYQRFGWSWTAVLDIYHTWLESGDLPPTPEPGKWQQLNRQLRQSK